eukprot:364800-Chlamydomonas_euryale.AAC.11
MSISLEPSYTERRMRTASRIASSSVIRCASVSAPPLPAARIAASSSRESAGITAWVGTNPGTGAPPLAGARGGGPLEPML